MEQLDRTVSYQIVQLCKRHRQHAEEALQAIGLHVGQELLLFQLWERSGLSHSELAEALTSDLSTVARTVQRMERAGLVQRRRDSEDARISRVYLTEEGRALYEPGLQVWKSLEEQLLAGLDQTEQTRLRHLLRQIASNFE